MDRGADGYRRYLSGDDTGLVSLVEEYKDGLMLFLNGYVSDLLLAEELTEETFFRLIIKRPRFSGKSSFKSFLYAIGRNVTVDYLRRHAKVVSLSAPDLEAQMTGAVQLEQEYLRKEQSIEVHRALMTLPADYRQALLLKHFEGFSNKEIALVMKKSDRQIKNLLYRAGAAMRHKLSKEGFPYEEC